MSESEDQLATNAADLEEERPESRPELPPPNFDFLIYSLRIQAELNMGLLPFGEKREPDFDLARHNIDLLVMLQEKTKGNLSLEEQRSLDNSVTELRFRFVQAKDQYSKDQQSKDEQSKDQHGKEIQQNA